MSDVTTVEGCLNCERGWHHECKVKDCRKCHGADCIDAGKPPTAPPLAAERTESSVDPALPRFAQQLLISFKINEFLSGKNAPLAMPLPCPEHGWVTTPLITCNRCLRIYPVLAFALPEQRASSGQEQTNEAVIFCDCGLRYYHPRCPLCEGQVDHIVSSEARAQE